jgi:uncharacterized protein (DUF305 family)
LTIKGLMTAVVVAGTCLMPGCAHPGHGAAMPRPRSVGSFQMASPAAYSTADLSFVDRTYVYVDDALIIARQASSGSVDPQLRELAAGLITVQQGNLQQLSGWLRQWGKKPPARPASDAGGRWPGLPADIQIKGLARLKAAAFDRAFLTLIIADQQGALAATTAERERGAFGPARQLAAQMAASSTLAIVHMRQMLSHL